ncbi:hypothetical protein OGAPHI_005030 [Ogataea philodendri]|uniref:Exonuclease 1 n=1 Tax=Ogataea philodendri TaxID=1378263 RepID=A0A9P8P2R1_9ASCO|nr:uncharacterized protein OGAPHI_005030 [Ogataea philodendri]KAH3663629.1 hypothetical protein OGAPHI_005030 [Ogataea philodendri]
MGVTGLLPALKSIQEPSHLSKYRGKTLAIDAYSWLHKAIYGCSMDIVLGKPTRSYLNYILRRLDALRHFGITPYMVLDGDYLPTKGNTEKERRGRREEYKRLGMEALRLNRRQEALNHFNKACDITPQMAKTVIEELKFRGVKYVVAPYEADSQMVYLEKQGLVQGIISEDSDLLIFGCQTLITKLDESGSCVEIQRAKFKECRESAIGLFDDAQLRLTAALSGCDYTKGISGVGMQRAATYVNKYKTFTRLMQAVRFEGKLKIPAEFEEEHSRAMIAFQYQVVFDPRTGKHDHLNPVPDDISPEYLELCAGKVLDDEIHRKIAIGDLDPMSKMPLLSRESPEKNVMSAAVPVPAKRTNTAPARTIDTMLSMAKPAKQRTSTAPQARKSALQTIDQFMTSQATTVKRRKILFGSQESGSEVSSYFAGQSRTTTLEDEDLKSVFSEQNSSDFNLTDPDDDDDLPKSKPISASLPARMPLRDTTNQVTMKLTAKKVTGGGFDRNSLSSFRFQGT